MEVQVSSEIGTLRSLIIHSPDSGIGKVAPSKAQDWLFEDILHLETVRKKEYDQYLKLLLYFLDPEKISGKIEQLDKEESRREFYKPGKPGFHNSEKVIEIEKLLADVLSQPDICQKLTASVCAIEGCSYKLQLELLMLNPAELAKVFISGTLSDKEMIFAPIPNFIFTRDIGTVINQHILLSKPAKKARSREALMARYIFFNHSYFTSYRDRILEIPDTIKYFLRPGEELNEKTTIEGGDIMVVSPRHVLIGCSERTSASGASEAIKLLFANEVIDKATVIKIPRKRDFMHIDTLFTQVNRHTWVILKSIAQNTIKHENDILDHISEKRNKEKPEIVQFYRNKEDEPRQFACIEELLDDISRNELQSKQESNFIYSGNGRFPYDVREQWTDSCNLLAVKEGVVLGYDRNDYTLRAFQEKGFRTISSEQLLKLFECGQLRPDEVENMFISIPSAELSRARGGFHCMSMPLLRDSISM